MNITKSVVMTVKESRVKNYCKDWDYNVAFRVRLGMLLLLIIHEEPNEGGVDK